MSIIRIAAITAAIVSLAGCASTKLLEADFDESGFSPAGAIDGPPSGDEIDLENVAHLYATRWAGSGTNPAIDGKSLFLQPPLPEHVDYEVRLITTGGHDPSRDRSVGWHGRKGTPEEFDCRLGALDDDDEFRYILHLRFTDSHLRVVDNGWKTIGPLASGEVHRIFVSYQSHDAYSVTLTQPGQPQARYPATGFAPAYSYGTPAVTAADRLILLCGYNEPKGDSPQGSAYVMDDLVIKQEKE